MFQKGTVHHYGLMDAPQMAEEDTALMRASLHLRGGKRQLQEGLSVAGLTALYDSLLFGMQYYIAIHERCKETGITSSDALWDHVALYHKLVKAGIFNDPCAFNRLSLILERALWEESFSFDADFTLAEIEKMLTKLGVLPFNESSLPSESRTLL